jgi:hypothetical protein
MVDFFIGLHLQGFFAYTLDRCPSQAGALRSRRRNKNTASFLTFHFSLFTFNLLPGFLFRSESQA